MSRDNYRGDTSPYSARKAFRLFARAVLRNGYHPIPIVPNAKRPALADWTFFCRNQSYPGLITKWLKSGEYTRCGLEIACGRSVIGIDIDERNQIRAFQAEQIVRSHLGNTPLVRYGEWPKRVLVYAAEGEPIPYSEIGVVQILGLDHQFVAYGIHPDTGKPYSWHPDGEPSTTPVDQLPCVSAERVMRLVRALGEFYGVEIEGSPAITLPDKDAARSSMIRTRPRPRSSPGRMLDEHGRVIDGRDRFLAQCVYYAAVVQGLATVEDVASQAWTYFSDHAGLTRPKGNGQGSWTLRDARTKARSTLRRFRSRHPAQRLHAKSREASFWTPEHREAFNLIVNEMARSRSSPAGGRQGISGDDAGPFREVRHLLEGRRDHRRGDGALERDREGGAGTTETGPLMDAHP